MSKLSTGRRDGATHCDFYDGELVGNELIEGRSSAIMCSVLGTVEWVLSALKGARHIVNLTRSHPRILARNKDRRR